MCIRVHLFCKSNKMKRTQKSEIKFRLSPVQFELYLTAGGGPALVEKLKREVEEINAKFGESDLEHTPQTKSKVTGVRISEDLIQDLEVACLNLSNIRGEKVHVSSFLSEVATKMIA